jgi:glycerate 2-kinase
MKQMTTPDVRALLQRSFKAAVAAADPRQMLAAHLPDLSGYRRVLAVGAGKASGAMAAALEDACPDTVNLSGIVVTRYGHALPTRRIKVVEAGHPVPDAAGEAGSREILAAVSELTSEDLLIVLVSGGGSSLLSLPADGLNMDELRATTDALLRCGAPITEMNVVRKHLSRIQGGWLAHASRAPVLSLIISDVAGDDPSAIASGPTVPDPSTFTDALAILDRYRAEVPAAVRARLEQGARGEIPETPKPGDSCFERVTNRMIATAQASLEAGAAEFSSAGIPVMMLGDTVTGEAREVAKVYAALVRQIRGHGTPAAVPVALVSGGECTVTIPAGVNGRGGRCTEFLVSLACELEGMEGVYALAADTDGIDGSEDNAGALYDPLTPQRAAAAGLTARGQLDAHDAFGYFAASDDLLTTGPTYTNVNDYRVILIL